MGLLKIHILYTVGRTKTEKDLLRGGRRHTVSICSRQRIMLMGAQSRMARIKCLCLWFSGRTMCVNGALYANTIKIQIERRRPAKCNGIVWRAEARIKLLVSLVGSRKLALARWLITRTLFFCILKIHILEGPQTFLRIVFKIVLYQTNLFSKFVI